MSDGLDMDMTGLLSTMEKMDAVVKSITASFNDLSAAIHDSNSSPNGSNFGGTGQLRLGSSGSNIMGSSFGNLPQMLSMNRRMNTMGAVAQGGIQALFGLAGGAFAGMPDVAMTTARSTAYYDAGTIAGMSRNSLATATFGAMRGGISGLGQDAVTAGILTSMGVNPAATGINRGQFANLATSTANAAKYLNISNADAASALGGLTQGKTSGNLMRNFGIWTTDPRTGRRLSPTEIFAQLDQRITGGRKISREALQNSYQGGNLGADLAGSGLDPTQQRLAYQYILDRTSGKNMDLGNKKLMGRLIAENKAGTNPQQALYDATGSQTGTMQAASDAYITGMQKAAGVIEQFNTAMQNFLKSPMGNMMAQANAGVSLAGNDPATGGLLGGIGSALGGLGGIGGTLVQNALLGRTMRGIMGGGGSGGGVGKGAGRPGGPRAGGKVTPAAGGAPGRSGVGRVGKMAGGAAAAGIIGGLNLANDAMNGQGWGTKRFSSDLGSTVGGMAGAALGTLLDPFTFGMGTFIGGYAGSWLGGQVGGMFGSGGGQSRVAGSRTSDTTGGIKLIHPVGNAKVTTYYGQTDKLHPNGHYAIDWGVGIGTPVLAAAAGTVIDAGGTAVNTMGTSDRSYGLYVEIDHGGGYSTWYGHLSSIGVSKGATVTQGQTIGLSGNTGYSTGPHLHFELRKNGNKVDPSSALGGNYASSAGTGGGTPANVALMTEGSGVGLATGSGSRAGAAGAAGAAQLGYSLGAQNIAGITIPGSYKGAATTSNLTMSSSSTSSVIGHGMSTTSAGASVGGGQGGDAPARSGGSSNTFNINLNISQASEAEARRFAKLIRGYLEEDKLVSSMGVL